MTATWPKTFPPLTPDQQRMRDEFMHAWHEELPKKYGIIEKFNHGYVVDHAPAQFTHTLEIGAGLGEHLAYEKLTAEQLANYVCVELRAAMAAESGARILAVRRSSAIARSASSSRMVTSIACSRSTCSSTCRTSPPRCARCTGCATSSTGASRS